MDIYSLNIDDVLNGNFTTESWLGDTYGNVDSESVLAALSVASEMATANEALVDFEHAFIVLEAAKKIKIAQKNPSKKSKKKKIVKEGIEYEVDGDIEVGMEGVDWEYEDAEIVKIHTAMEGVGSKMIEGIKKAWRAVCKFFKRIWDAISGYFTNKKYKDEIEELKATIAKNGQKMIELSASNNFLRAMSAARQKKIEILTKASATLQATLADMTQKLASTKTLLSNANSQLDAADRDNMLLTQQKEELEVAYGNRNTKVAELQKYISELEEMLTAPKEPEVVSVPVTNIDVSGLEKNQDLANTVKNMLSQIEKARAQVEGMNTDNPNVRRMVSDNLKAINKLANVASRVGDKARADANTIFKITSSEEYEKKHNLA